MTARTLESDSGCLSATCTRRFAAHAAYELMSREDGFHAEGLGKRCCYNMKLVLMMQAYTSWGHASQGGKRTLVDHMNE